MQRRKVSTSYEMASFISLGTNAKNTSLPMPPLRPDAKEKLDQWLKLIEGGLTTRKAAEQVGLDSAHLYRYKNKFYPDLTVTKEVYNEDGELVRTIKGIRENTDVDTSKLKIKGITTTPHGGAYVKYENPDLPSWEDFRDEFIKAAKTHAPKYQTVKRKKASNGHLLVMDIADIHMGKYASAAETGGDYNMDVTEARVKEALGGLLQKASGFEVDQILLVIGNDALHIDSPKRTTTSGTPQDTDGQWHEAFIRCRKLYIHLIETLLPIAKLHIVFNPSNHDFQSGFMLADSVACWFRNSDATFDVDPKHRKYFKYGQSMIGTTHGDGAKEKDLVKLMAHEKKKMWAETTYRYWYCHHLHHKIAKEDVGACIEYLRSPSSADAWHDRNGYVALPAAEAFIHSKDKGQVARLTHYL